MIYAPRKKEDRIGYIVSSLKTNKGKETVEIQRAALASWQRYGKKVVLFNQRSDLDGYDLSSAELISPPNATTQLRPVLHAMGRNQNEFSALVAPNVVLNENIAKVFAVHAKHKLSRAWAMSAQIPSITQGDSDPSPTPDRSLLDVFIGSGAIWAYVANEVENLTIFDGSDWALHLNRYLKLRLLGNRYYDGTKLGLAVRLMGKSKKVTSDINLPISELPLTQYVS